MKKIVLFILLFICLKGMSQGNDTTKFYPSNDYGWNYKRLKARLAFIPPSDTVGNKLGLVMLNGNLYSGNGVWWTASSVIANTYALLNGQNDFSQRQRMFNSLVVYNGIFSTNIFAQSVGGATPGIGAWLGVGDSVTKRSWNLQLNTSGALDFNYYNGFTNTYNKRGYLDSLGNLTITGKANTVGFSNTGNASTTGIFTANSISTVNDITAGNYLYGGGIKITSSDIELNASGVDQWLKSLTVSSSANGRRGFYTDNGVVGMHLSVGGNTTRGTVTESANVMSFWNTGGANTTKYHWWDAGAGSMFLMDAAAALNTSYFPLTVNGNISKVGGTSTQALFADGSTQQIIAAEYTPTFSNGNNTNSWALSAARYIRIGAEVHVAMTVTVNSTSGGNNAFYFTLPVSSNFTQTGDASGSGSAYVTGGQFYSGMVYGDAALDKAYFNYYQPASGSYTFSIEFTYVVK